MPKALEDESGSRRLSFFRRIAKAWRVHSLLFFLAFSFAIGTSLSCFAVEAGPRIYLWVWQYDADMSWIDCESIGISYLAGTVRIGPKSEFSKPRLNTLRIPRGAHVEAVVRVEAAEGVPLADERVSQVRELILDLVGDRPVESLQIDFDAKKSQRSFYTKLLQSLRSRFPGTKDLNMTALASWLTYDRWTQNLPVAHVVPMLFRMGIDHDAILRFLRKKSFLISADSLGLSVDEPDVLEALSHSKGDQLKRLFRIYIFSPGGWQKRSSQEFVNRIQELSLSPASRSN